MTKLAPEYRKRLGELGELMLELGMEIKKYPGKLEGHLIDETDRGPVEFLYRWYGREELGIKYRGHTVVILLDKGGSLADAFSETYERLMWREVVESGRLGKIVGRLKDTAEKNGSA